MPLDRARTRRADRWPQSEAMGWTAMTADEMDLDHATEALVFAELGRHLAPAALLSSAVAARWAGHGGKVALALPDGGAVRVFDGEGAATALGLFGDRVGRFALPAPLQARPSLDLSISIAHLVAPARIDPVEIGRAHV